MGEPWPSGQTRRPGSAKVFGSNPGCATKIVRHKNLAVNIGDCGSRVARVPCKAVGPMYIGRAIPEHVKDPRASDKGRVLIPGITGQIPELLRLVVKLQRHHYR